VIADDDPAVAHRIVAVARQLTEARLVVRVRYGDDVDALREAGADAVISEVPESVVQLYAEVLRGYERTASEVAAAEDDVRRDGYRRLRAVVGGAVPHERGSRHAAPATSVDPEQLIVLERRSDSCRHVASLRPVHPSARGCEECLRAGDRWVHLRICLSCGHVGCCDSSKNQHATWHHRATGHPVVRTLEPGEDWAWCYVDEVTL
jgi:hypothetical protein